MLSFWVVNGVASPLMTVNSQKETPDPLLETPKKPPLKESEREPCGVIQGWGAGKI